MEIQQYEFFLMEVETFQNCVFDSILMSAKYTLAVFGWFSVRGGESILILQTCL